MIRKFTKHVLIATFGGTDVNVDCSSNPENTHFTISTKGSAAIKTREEADELMHLICEAADLTFGEQS